MASVSVFYLAETKRHANWFVAFQTREQPKQRRRFWAILYIRHTVIETLVEVGFLWSIDATLLELMNRLSPISTVRLPDTLTVLTVADITTWWATKTFQFYFLWQIQQMQISFCRATAAIGCTKEKLKVSLYSAHFCSTRKPLRHLSHSFTYSYSSAYLYLVSVHQMALPQTEVADI